MQLLANVYVCPLMLDEADPGSRLEGSGEDTAMPERDPTSRRRRSLVGLTKRFLRLLQESKGGVLDLKKASVQISLHHYLSV